MIVAAHNEEACIERLVRSVLAQSWGQLELLLVDDGSDDRTAERARAAAGGDPRLRLTSLPLNGGVSAARNCALGRVRGEWVAIVDADSWMETDWLARLLAPLLAGTADCVGGPDFVPVHSPLLARCVGYSMDSPLATGGIRYGSSLAQFLPGSGNLACRADLFARVGGYDTRFRQFGEDKEWAYRAVQSGARTRFVPEAFIWHERTHRLGVHARKMFGMGRARLDICRRWPASTQPAHLLPPLCAPGAFWLALRFPLAALLLMLLWGLAEGIRAARQLKDGHALLLAPCTSALIPLGYIAGFWWRIGELVAQQLPHPGARRVPTE